MFIRYTQVRCDIDRCTRTQIIEGDDMAALRWALANGWQQRWDEDTRLKLQTWCPTCIRNEEIGEIVLGVRSIQQQAPIQ